MSDPINALERSEVGEPEGRWTTRFMLFLRIMAGVSLVKGLYHWALVIGVVRLAAIRGESDKVTSGSSAPSPTSPSSPVGSFGARSPDRRYGVDSSPGGFGINASNVDKSVPLCKLALYSHTWSRPRCLAAYSAASA